MRLRIFTCPECKFRKFDSLAAVNIHLGKMHSVPYRIFFKNNKPYIKMKKRAKAEYIKS